MNRTLPLAVLAVLLVACSGNVKVQEFVTANEPAGIATTVKLTRFVVDGNRLDGELLAADMDGFTLLLEEPLETGAGEVRLVRVPRELVREVKLAQVGSFLIRQRQDEREADKLQRFQLLSRFPQGLGDGLLEALLAAHGQTALYSPEKQR